MQKDKLATISDLQFFSAFYYKLYEECMKAGKRRHRDAIRYHTLSCVYAEDAREQLRVLLLKEEKSGRRATALDQIDEDLETARQLAERYKQRIAEGLSEEPQ